MLTPIGLLLNFTGSIILLGSDVDLIETAVKKVDPVHFVYTRGLDYIIRESKNEELTQQRRAHPFDQPVEARGLTWWAISWFLDRHVEQDIPRVAQVDIRGGWFKIDGEQITFIEDGSHVGYSTRASLNAILSLIHEAFLRRIYIYGVSLLALGFFLQLVNSMY